MSLIQDRINALEQQLTETREAAQGATLDGNPIFWVWLWVGGGWNDCMARTEAEAREKAKELGGDKCKVNWSTFKPILTQAERNSWYNNNSLD